MGNTQDPELPPRNPVPEGKTRICVAGYSMSVHLKRARNVANELAKADPNAYETWFYAPSRDKFFEWLANWKQTETVPDQWKDHKTSPICWFERSGQPIEIIGGRDRLCEWTIKNHPDTPAAKLADSTPYGELLGGDVPTQTAT